jgi:hypothetical protein
MAVAASLALTIRPRILPMSNLGCTGRVVVLGSRDRSYTLSRDPPLPPSTRGRLNEPCLWRKLPLASNRLETTGEDILQMATGGIKDKRTGLGIVKRIRKIDSNSNEKENIK